MKVVFVYSAYESLGIEYLSAMLTQNGHETSLVFDPTLFNDSFIQIQLLHTLFSIRKNLVQSILDEKPDLIAFSVLHNNYTWFKHLSIELKKSCNTPIVAGGHHVTNVPEAVLHDTPIDYTVIGEGEHTLLSLVESLEHKTPVKNIPGLAYRQNNKIKMSLPKSPDIDTLPFPDKTIYDNTSFNNKNVYTMITSRGCPFSCTYCNHSYTKELLGSKNYYRVRSVDNVIEELRQAKEKYNPLLINIYDDIFGASISWFRTFTDKYIKEIGIPYMACTHPSYLTEERARLYSESGCIKLDMGVQTINIELKRKVLNRKESNDDIINAITLLKKSGIHLAVDNILNLPGENEEHLIEMINFYRKNRPDTMKFYWLTYLPRTKIIDIAVRKGTLTRDRAKEINEGIFQECSSIATGGYSSNKLVKKFYLLVILMQFIPDPLMEKIIDKKLYRLLPTSSLFVQCSFAILRLINRTKRKTSVNPDAMIDRHIAHYKFYLKKILKSKIPGISVK